jgi:uncharacterized protein YqhQ
MMTSNTPSVGGQAVVEGVMMRSPSAASVAVRRPDGSIIVRVRSSYPASKRFPILAKPGFRGMIVLVETMMDGISALNFSATHAAAAEPDKSADNGSTPSAPSASLTQGAIVLTLVVAMAFGFALFTVLPHFLTWGLGQLLGNQALSGGQAASFHLVDGVIKLGIFVLYIWLISLMKDMRRVFEYHGAEHQAVHTFEKNLELTPANLASFDTEHPRCGTAFLVTVIAVSIFVFAGVFPLLPQLSSIKVVNQILYVFIKLPLILPIGAISYEVIRFAGRKSDSWFGRMISAPGIWMQHITTRTPDSQQQEIAIVALQTALKSASTGISPENPETILEFHDYAAFQVWLGQIEPEVG